MLWIKKVLGISEPRFIDDAEDIPLNTQRELQLSLERMERSIKRAQELFQQMQEQTKQ